MCPSATTLISPPAFPSPHCLLIVLPRPLLIWPKFLESEPMHNSLLLFHLTLSDTHFPVCYWPSGQALPCQGLGHLLPELSGCPGGEEGERDIICRAFLFNAGHRMDLSMPSYLLQAGPKPCPPPSSLTRSWFLKL